MGHPILRLVGRAFKNGGIVWAVAAVLLLWVAAVPAQGQQIVCHDRADTLDYLRQNYAEAPIALGLANNGGVIEVLASPDGKSWTILITSPDGMICPLASGVGWETVKTLPGTGG